MLQTVHPAGAFARTIRADTTRSNGWQEGPMRRALTLLAVLGLILTGCTSATTSTSTSTRPAGPTRLVMRVEADWSYDVFAPPQYTLGGFEFAYATYDSLLAYEPGTWKLIPYIASSYTNTPTSVTFKIRDGVTCTDGT